MVYLLVRFHNKRLKVVDGLLAFDRESPAIVRSRLQPALDVFADPDILQLDVVRGVHVVLSPPYCST
jgi:hypothetical protein